MYEKEFKKKLIIKILNEFSFDKDLEEVFKESLFSFNIEQKDHKRIIAYHFPNHFNDVITFFSEIISIEFQKSIPKKFKKMRISEKIKYSIINRLVILDDYDINYKDLFEFMLQPNNLIFSQKILFNICDDMWYLSGDKSLDFNYYSKRLILMKIYFSSFRFWINDSSENKEKTNSFVENQLKVTSKIGKYKSLFKKGLKNLRIKFF